VFIRFRSPVFSGSVCSDVALALLSALRLQFFASTVIFLSVTLLGLRNITGSAARMPLFVDIDISSV